MKLELKPRVATGANRGVVEWNPETGDLKFNSPMIEGDFVYLLERAAQTGFIHTRPFPSILRVNDPTHNKTEFAALCGMFWEVPEPLKAYYPKPEKLNPS